jgi:hypothetical protein
MSKYFAIRMELDTMARHEAYQAQQPQEQQQLNQQQTAKSPTVQTKSVSHTS